MWDSLLQELPEVGDVSCGVLRRYKTRSVFFVSLRTTQNE